MRYEVKKGNIVLHVDDNVFFEDQPRVFRELFSQMRGGNSADFDNCNIMILDNGRVVITEKLEEDGEV